MWMESFLKTCFLRRKKAPNWPSAPTLYIADWLKQCFPHHYIKGEPHGTPHPPTADALESQVNFIKTLRPATRPFAHCGHRVESQQESFKVTFPIEQL